MAPVRTLYRFWCSECKAFTLHTTEGDTSCEICGTTTTSYKLSEVPVELLEEQRLRYKASEKKKSEELFSRYFKPQPTLFEEMLMEDMGLYDPYKPKIIEDDAGQKAIDDEIREQNHQASLKRQAEQQALKEEFDKFKNLGRNDKCACGSGKKYKQCCISKYSHL